MWQRRPMLLGVLDDEAAVALFCTHSRLPTYVLEELRPTIVALVRLLDGSPLAITKVAELSVAVSPRVMLEKDIDLFSLVLGTDDDPSELRSSLSTAIASLTEGEACALARLCIVDGVHDLSTCAVLFNTDDTHAVLLLHALCCKGLVRTTDDGTGFSVWSSVRRLTNGALTDDEHAVVWRRFAEHVVMQATILGGERHGPDVAALDHRLEHFAPHLEHIAKRATASDPLLAARALAGWGAYASRRGPFGPFERLCDDVIARLDDDTPEVRLLKARILLDYAAVRFHRADFVGAQTRALSAMELSGELDARLTAEANTVLMVILQCQGTGETPADIMPSSMAAAFALGVLLVHRGDLVGCVQCCERALVLSYVGETRWRGRVRWLLGLAYHERGLLAEADTSYREARTLLTEAGDAYFHVVLEHCVALLEHERGDTSAAITRKEPLRQQLEDIGDVFFSGSFDGYQALLLMTRRGEGDLERAAALFDRALQIARGSGDHYRLSLFLPARAMLACEHGDVATARAYLHEVKPFAAMPVNRNVPAMASLARARLALLEGRPDEAAACCLAVRRPEQTAHGEHPPIVDVSSDVRFLLRVLEQALERSGVHPPQAPRSRLVVFDDGFVVNDGAFVSLKKHRTLLRVLRALTVLDAFGKTTQRSTKDIISAVWPGQQFEGDSGAHRVHVAVSTLRRMGMSAFLHHRSGSYLIDADVECRLSELEFGRAASEP